MSADTLRRAAAIARDEWAGEVSGPFRNAARTHLAVADWLDHCAAIEDEHGVGGSGTDYATAIARAYLGDES